MKSEHRHELKTNELERIASDWGHASEQYVQQHTNQLIAAAVVVIAIVIGAIYWRTAAGSYVSQGWRALSDAQSTADFGTVADKYAGTKVAPWARLQEGEAELSSGVRALFTDRDAGRSDINKAAENFEKLINDKSTPDDVVDRALFGLARCREAVPPKGTSPGTINNPAIEVYERLLKRDTPYKQLAEQRITALRTATDQDFNAWFALQNPKPADRAMPKDLSIPPLPEDFGPAAGKSSGAATKKGTKAAPKPEKPSVPGKSSTAAPTAGKSGAAAPAKANSHPPRPQGGPALPQPSAPASK
jgi:hypothetical protein